MSPATIIHPIGMGAAVGGTRSPGLIVRPHFGQVAAVRLIIDLQFGHGANLGIIHSPADFSGIIPTGCEHTEAR